MLIRYIYGQVVISLFLFGLFLFIVQIHSHFDITFLFSGLVLLLTSTYCSIDVFFMPRVDTVERLYSVMTFEHLFAIITYTLFLWFIHSLTRSRQRFILILVVILALVLAGAFLGNFMLFIDGQVVRISPPYQWLYYPFQFSTMIYMFYLLIAYAIKSEKEERRMLVLQTVGLMSMELFACIDLFYFTRDGYPLEISPSFLQFTNFGLVLLGICIIFAFGRRLIQLVKERSVMQKLSMLDGLTNLSNRRAFYESLEREIARSRRFSTHTSLLMMDMDNFKRLNDTHGHLAGDQVLRRFSDCLKQNVRATDIPARYGGEEFAVILPRTEESGALTLAEKLRSQVEALIIHWHGSRLNATVSIGCATYPQDAATLHDLIHHADACLYHSKANGKNRVSLYSQQLASP